jgi:hypothetical protein
MSPCSRRQQHIMHVHYMHAAVGKITHWSTDAGQQQADAARAFGQSLVRLRCSFATVTAAFSGGSSSSQHRSVSSSNSALAAPASTTKCLE